MILEPQLLLAEALEHDTYGVNAKLAGLPRYPDDERPTPVRRVLAQARDDEAQRGNPGSDLPVLVVAQAAQVNWEGEVTVSKRDTTGIGLRMAVGYVTVETAITTARGYRHTSYTMRALGRTLRDWLSNANQADRVKHGIQVRDSLGWQLDPIPREFLDTGLVIAAALYVDLFVRDLNTSEGP